MEIKLNQVEDPIRFVLTVLKRLAAICETFQTDNRLVVAQIYTENAGPIDECHRDINVAWNTLRSTVIIAGSGKMDEKKAATKVQEAVVRSVHVAQKTLDLLDDLCVRYSIPQTDRFLFAKIGTVLHP